MTASVKNLLPSVFLLSKIRDILPQLIAALIGSWGYFCTGTVRGWSSPGIPSMKKATRNNVPMTDNDYTWISSLPPLCAVFGALLIGWPMQRFGRKVALICLSIPFCVGFLIMGFTFFAHHKAQLYVGRILTGLMNGAATPASQIYIAECSSSAIRGTLGSLTATALALGILVTYIIGAFVPWHVLAWILASFPLVLTVGMIFEPETPVWLLSHGRPEEARRSLQKLRGKDSDVSEEFEQLLEAQKTQDAVQTKTKISAKDLFSGPALKPLGISMGIMFFQQFTGINAVVYYTVSIFQSAGSSIDSRYATIIVGFVQLLFTAASGFLVDRFGRRALLFGSAFGVAISLAAMGTFFHYKVKWGDAEATSRLGWLPLVSLVVFFASFSCGFANVPFIIMGELFPFRYRSVLGPISSSFNLLCAFTVVRSYPNLEKALGRNGAFWFFMACTLLSIAFVYFLLPETKGKSLQEIEQLFESISKSNKSNKVKPADASAKQTAVQVIQVSSSYTQTEPMDDNSYYRLPNPPPPPPPPASTPSGKLKSATFRPQVDGWISSNENSPAATTTTSTSLPPVDE